MAPHQSNKGRGDACVAQAGSGKRLRKRVMKPNKEVMAVDEYINLESVDPDFDKPPEFIEHLLGHKIPNDDY